MRSGKILLGGIDIETTGCKLSLYQDDSTYLAVFVAAYPFARSAGISSFDASVIMEAVLLVLEQAVEAYPQLDFPRRLVCKPLKGRDFRDLC